MSDTNFEELMRSSIQATLVATYPNAKVYTYNLNPSLGEGAKVVAAIEPVSPSQDIPLRKVIILVRLTAESEAVGKAAMELIHAAYREKNFPAPTANNQFKVYCVSLGGFVYLGHNNAGLPQFSESFELTSIYT